LVQAASGFVRAALALQVVVLSVLGVALRGTVAFGSKVLIHSLQLTRDGQFKCVSVAELDLVGARAWRMVLNHDAPLRIGDAFAWAPSR
jgi:hypothetical protein